MLLDVITFLPYVCRVASGFSFSLSLLYSPSLLFSSVLLCSFLLNQTQFCLSHLLNVSQGPSKHVEWFSYHKKNHVESLCLKHLEIMTHFHCLLGLVVLFSLKATGQLSSLWWCFGEIQKLSSTKLTWLLARTTDCNLLPGKIKDNTKSQKMKVIFTKRVDFLFIATVFVVVSAVAEITLDKAIRKEIHSALGGGMWGFILWGMEVVGGYKPAN